MAVGVQKAWSVTAASNGNSDSNANWAEGMLAPSINNSARANMAAIKGWANQIQGGCTYGGSSNAYTITSDAVAAISTAYGAGMMFMLKANHTNTGAATLNVDGVGAVAIKTSDGGDLVAGDITSGGLYLLAYNSTGPRFDLIGTFNSGAFQPLDATLTAVAAASSSTTNQFFRATDVDTFTFEGASSFRSALGLGTAAVKATGTSGNTVPLLDGANTWSGDQTISSTGPNFYLQETDASTNNKLWRMLAQGEDLYFGAVNDALSSAGYWAVISRTGVTIDAIALAATALTFNGVAIPTISSSDTLSNKTLSSPTLSGTVGGSPTASGAWTFSGNVVTFSNTGASLHYIQVTNQFLSARFGTNSSAYPAIMDGSNNSYWQFDTNNSVHIFGQGAIQARVAISSETSGTLTSASANKHLALTGNITLNNSVFSANDKMTLDPGTSARTITRGSGCTMYVNGTDSATATLAANQMGGVHVRSASVFVLTGAVS